MRTKTLNMHPISGGARGCIKGFLEGSGEKKVGGSCVNLNAVDGIIDQAHCETQRTEAQDLRKSIRATE